MLGSFRLG